MPIPWQPLAQVAALAAMLGLPNVTAAAMPPGATGDRATTLGLVRLAAAARLAGLTGERAVTVGLDQAGAAVRSAGLTGDRAPTLGLSHAVAAATSSTASSWPSAAAPNRYSRGGPGRGIGAGAAWTMILPLVRMNCVDPPATSTGTAYSSQRTYPPRVPAVAPLALRTTPHSPPDKGTKIGCALKS